ncbi:MAG TPA: glycosyltransferase, partial [Terriglobia bacterium]|nr:glycosyltransferase [Terriglobia bacterium]
MMQGKCPSQTETRPLVALAIVNFNGWKDTLECLESVRRLAYANYLCVLVDNNSSDDSLERIRGWAREKQREGFVLA